MNHLRPDAADEPATENPAPSRRLPDRFSDWGPDYGPQIIDGYEEPPYDEPEPEDHAR